MRSQTTGRHHSDKIPRPSDEEVEGQLYNLFRWQMGWSTSFSAKLFELFTKADLPNRHKLQQAFPVHAAALDWWIQHPNPEELWEEMGFIEPADGGL